MTNISTIISDFRSDVDLDAATKPQAMDMTRPSETHAKHIMPFACNSLKEM